MIDINKQIAYWKNSAHEDWLVANELVNGGRIRHGLFFVHLALEKALKAHVCRKIGDLSPRTHNLLKLVELAGLELTTQQISGLAIINSFNLEGRYPDTESPIPSKKQAAAYLEGAEEILQWLTQAL